jgi:hypothetical protein
VTDNRVPAWVREVDFSLVLHPQIMLGSAFAGLDQPAANVEWDYVPIGSILWQVCQRRGYAALATLDPISGALSVRSDGETPTALRPFTSGPLPVDQIAGLLQAVVGHQGAPIGLMFPYTGRLFPAAGLPEPQLLELMGRIEALGHIAQPAAGARLRVGGGSGARGLFAADPVQYSVLALRAAGRPAFGLPSEQSCAAGRPGTRAHARRPPRGRGLRHAAPAGGRPIRQRSRG